MKPWLLVLAMLIGPLANAKVKTPTLDDVKFVKGQTIKYDPPKFYTRVCSGKAKIYDVYLDKKQIKYTIETEGSPCPLFFEATEDGLEAVD